MNNADSATALYIYGIVPTYYSSEEFRKLESISVLHIPFKKVAALVSRAPRTDYRQLGAQPLAKLLVDHQLTIEKIMGMGFSSILPMRLGSFADSAAEVIGILENGYDLLLGTLEKTADFHEIDIVATWADFESILLMVASNPAIMDAKTELEKRGEAISSSDQVKLGSMVHSLLEELRIHFARLVEEALKPFCLMLKQHERGGEKMVSNTAFLVDRQHSGTLENALDKLDEDLHGALNFKMVGPLPCYSFYTMEIREMSVEEIESSLKLLEMTNPVSEKKIRNAYLEKVKQFHPDANPDSYNSLQFNEIRKAHQTLTDFYRVCASGQDEFSLSPETVSNHRMFIKIKE